MNDINSANKVKDRVILFVNKQPSMFALYALFVFFFCYLLMVVVVVGGSRMREPTDSSILALFYFFRFEKSKTYFPTFISQSYSARFLKVS